LNGFSGDPRDDNEASTHATWTAPGEQTDWANEEQRGQPGIGIERQLRAARHGSSLVAA